MVLLKGLQTTFLCAQNKYKSVETKTFCYNIKIANETEQKKKQVAGTTRQSKRGAGYSEGWREQCGRWSWGRTRCSTFDRAGLAFIGNSVAICVNDS